MTSSLTWEPATLEKDPIHGGKTSPRHSEVFVLVAANTRIIAYFLAPMVRGVDGPYPSRIYTPVSLLDLFANTFLPRWRAQEGAICYQSQEYTTEYLSLSPYLWVCLTTHLPQ